MSETRPTTKGMISDGVEICNKLTELPKTAKEILMVAGIGASLYIATHLNTTEYTDSDTRYYRTSSVGGLERELDSEGDSGSTWPYVLLAGIGGIAGGAYLGRKLGRKNPKIITHISKKGNTPNNK